jgi:hypothetical protein
MKVAPRTSGFLIYIIHCKRWVAWRKYQSTWVSKIAGLGAKAGQQRLTLFWPERYRVTGNNTQLDRVAIVTDYLARYRLPR